MNSAVTGAPGFDLEDGAPHGLWIDYDGMTDLLQVFVGVDPTLKPSTPVVSLTVDLPAQVGSTAWFGFGAATGALINNHDVLSLDLTTCTGCTVDTDCDDGLFCNGDESCAAGVLCHREMRRARVAAMKRSTRV